MSAMKRHLEDVIYQMHDEGKTVKEIAEYLGTDEGMVALYVSHLTKEDLNDIV